MTVLLQRTAPAESKLSFGHCRNPAGDVRNGRSHLEQKSPDPRGAGETLVVTQESDPAGWAHRMPPTCDAPTDPDARRSVFLGLRVFSRASGSADPDRWESVAPIRAKVLGSCPRHGIGAARPIRSGAESPKISSAAPGDRPPRTGPI